MKRYVGLLFGVGGLLAVALGTVFATSGCKGVGCLIEDRVATALTNTAVTTLECSNRTAVEKDIKALVAKAGLCKAAATKKLEHQTGIIGNAVCPLLASALVDLLADKAIPSEWQCNPAKAKGTAKALLDGACRSIFPVREDGTVPACVNLQ